MTQLLRNTGRTSASQPLADGSHRRLGALPVAALSLLLLIGTIVSIFFVPSVLVDRRLRENNSALTTAERLKSENDIRTALLQGIGGLFFIATAFFTARQLRVSQDQLIVARRQTDLNSERQLSERFAEGLTQLAAPSALVRVGGVYLMDGIAKHSAEYVNPVAEVLSTLLQNETESFGNDLLGSSRRDQSLPLDAAIAVLARLVQYHGKHGPIEMDNLAGDEVAVAGTFVGGYLHDLRVQALDMTAATFVASEVRGLRAESATLNGGTFVGCNLDSLRFEVCDFRRTNLSRSRIRELRVDRALFQYASLFGCEVVNMRAGVANFHRAVLARGSFKGVRAEVLDLRNCSLTEAWIENLHVDEADLTSATAGRAAFRGLRANVIRFNAAMLVGARLEDLVVAELDCTNTSLREASLTNVRVDRLDVTGADLAGCQLDDVVIEELVISAETVLPDGVTLPKGTELQVLPDGRYQFPLVVASRVRT